MKKLKDLIKNRKFYVTLVVCLFTLKVLTYYILIDANISGLFNLLISYILFVSIFFRLALSKWKHSNIMFLIIYTGFSILMFADSMYYNYYHQTVSIKQLWQLKNVSSVPESVVATLIPASIFLLIDIPFIYILFKRIKNKSYKTVYDFFNKYYDNMKYFTRIVALLLLLVVINPLTSNTFSRINSMEFFSNHFNDVYIALTENIISEKISAEEILEVVEGIQEDEVLNPKYHGIAEGKNLILVQVESLQNFVIFNEYLGEEVTPNLNKLINNNSLYFDKYYSTIGKGNTVDAEFTTFNSLYPDIEREAYTLYEENTFYGLPWLLRDEGYKTAAFHGYKGEFWNRENAYPGQGIEEFYSMEDLDQSDIIGMGISDISVYNQSVEIMKEYEEPFFGFIITLTNHHPYLLPEELTTIDLLEEHEETKFGNYLQTVKYTDYAIGEFIEELKEAGLYEDSIIVFYGDHHGLNYKMDNNDIIVSEYLDKPYDYDEMLNIPLIIHIPDSGITETISTTGGCVDFLPTIANLMNLQIPHLYILGQDLVNGTDGFVAFTSYLLEGSFVHNDVMLEISRDGVLEDSRAWDTNTYESISPELLEEYYNKAIKLKQTSKEILEQDLITRD